MAEKEREVDTKETHNHTEDKEKNEWGKSTRKKNRKGGKSKKGNAILIKGKRKE